MIFFLFTKHIIFWSFIELLFLATVQPGLRGVFFYTYDESFIGADLIGQELNPKELEKLYSNKEYITKPKPLQDSYKFLGLLDGRCDVQLKCEKKECEASVKCNSTIECPPCKGSTCLNGAPDISFPDCCINGGKGKHCCKNGADNPGCHPFYLPITKPCETTYRPPVTYTTHTQRSTHSSTRVSCLFYFNLKSYLTRF